MTQGKWRMGMGWTFFPKQYSGTVKSHLMIIISDPDQNADEIALVHTTSIRPGEAHDASCTFKGGEHRNIYKPCYVKYDAAQLRSSVELSILLDAGHLHLSDDLKAVHLKRVQRGAILSDRTPIRVRQVLKEQGLV